VVNNGVKSGLGVTRSANLPGMHDLYITEI